MSFIREVVTGVVENYRRGHRLRKRIDELSAEIAALRQDFGRLHGGSSHTAALNLESPLVWLRLSFITTDELTIRGVKIFHRYVEGAFRYAEDADDAEVDYVILPDPRNGLFLGARVLAAHVLNAVVSESGLNRGVYAIVAGETQGFAAEITGERDVNGYPWRQHLLHEDDAYTHESDPAGIAAPLGRARVGYSQLYDSAITERMEFEAGDLVWIQPMGGEFLIQGFADAEHSLC